MEDIKTVLRPKDQGFDEAKDGDRHQGIYLWEKDRTLKITELSVSWRANGRKWRSDTTAGVTLTPQNKLRFWEKYGSKFKASKLPHTSLQYHLPAEAVRAFCLRNNLVPQDSIIELMAAQKYPVWAAVFGAETAVKLEYRIDLSLFKEDLDIKPLLRSLCMTDSSLMRQAESALLAGDTNLFAAIVLSDSLSIPVNMSTPDFSLINLKDPPLWSKHLPLRFRTWALEFAFSEEEYTVLQEEINFRPEDYTEEIKSLKYAIETAYCKRNRREHVDLTHEQIERWQEEGLIDHNDQGYLLWKCVTRDYRGVLGAPYEIGLPFDNNGMSAAGPWGAVREYGRNDRYVLALRCPNPSAAHSGFDGVRDGVFHTGEGIPTALYKITEKDEDGFVPILIEGTDEMEILTGFPTKKGQ